MFQQGRECLRTSSLRAQTQSASGWLDVAVEHISSLVGSCVDFRIVLRRFPKGPAVFMHLANSGEPLHNHLDTCVTSELSLVANQCLYARHRDAACFSAPVSTLSGWPFSVTFGGFSASLGGFFLPQLTRNCSAALPVTSRSAAQFSRQPKPNRRLMDGCGVGGLCGREGDRLSN